MVADIKDLLKTMRIERPSDCKDALIPLTGVKRLTAKELTEALGGRWDALKRLGKARCPAHDDSNPSISCVGRVRTRSPPSTGCARAPEATGGKDTCARAAVLFSLFTWYMLIH
jgi:hypothetical protein